MAYTLPEMINALKEFGSSKDKEYVSPYFDTLQEIKDLEDLIKSYRSTGDNESMNEIPDMENEIRELKKKYLENPRFRNVVKMVFNRNIKDKYEKSKQSESQKRLNVKIKEAKEEFNAQYERAKNAIQDLKSNIKDKDDSQEIIDDLSEMLDKAKEEFDKSKNKDFKNEEDVRVLLGKPKNELNKLIGRVRNIMKHGKELTTDEKKDRSVNKMLGDYDKRVRKSERAKNKAEKEKSKADKQAEKLAKRWKKYSGEDETSEPTEEPTIKPNDDLPSSQEPDIKKLVNLMNSNKEDLNQDAVEFANDVVSKISTGEATEEDAKAAIESALESEPEVIAESRKRIHRRILFMFSD